MLRGKYDVAIKIMFDSQKVDIENDEEIHFLKRVRHPRLVMFLGCGRIQKTGNIFVVLEMCERGDLTSFIHKGKEKKWDRTLALLADVSEAMSYLHFFHNSVHRDLKSANVLLNEESGT